MSAVDRLKSFKFFGNTKETIDAIEKYIETNNYTMNLTEEEPAASINKVIEAAKCEETSLDIQKIINNL